ncbi:hypodermin-A isoform X1 [Manduca sexta]|uniref:hypodermin-A isoform X1 n=2 Tax=Manduca sexta TaxID=7130 RepID=UPI00188E3EF3|nr:hypodermin-A isoform X1 [Manduca sexta]
MYRLLLVFVVINLISCQDYSAIDYYSVESYEGDIFNEVFNSSTKEKPKRIKLIKNVTSKELKDLENKMAPTRCNHQVFTISEESDEDKNLLIGYPFSVSIQRKGAHYATGALVNKRWILSSASEFYNVRETIKLFRVRLGSVDCKRGGSLKPIKHFEIHPSYVYRKPSFDLCLLRMAALVHYSQVVQPIKLSKVTAKVISAKFMTTYWPRIVIKGKVLPKYAKERLKQSSMRVSTQKMIPWDECSVMVAAANETLDESSLCLKSIARHHSACMPDVGAPVIANDGLWGVTSGWTAANCTASLSPTIFTRISSAAVRSWLDAHSADV